MHLKKSHDYLCSHKFTFNIRSGAGDEVAVKRPLGGDGDKFRMPDLSLNFTCSFSNPHLLFTSLTCCISPHHR
jgi:hypothetical protein